MPILTTDTDGLTFTADNQQWIVKQGVVIARTTDGGAAVNMPTSGGQFINHGVVSSTGVSHFDENAVLVEGDGAVIVNGEGASLVAFGGVEFLDIDRSQFFNQGSVIGLGADGVSYIAFEVHDSQVENHTLHNSGYIFGASAGVHSSRVGGISIVNSGVIESDGTGIFFATEPGQLQSVRVTNTGLIKGEKAAIDIVFASSFVKNTGTIVGSVTQRGAEVDKIVNNGLIDGNVEFWDGDDVYKGTKGVIDGTVSAGRGDDTLKGGRHEEEFYGGKGDDLLKSRGGEDTLVGGGGADKMSGGGGGDVFVYEDVKDSTEGARDVILKFRSGSDMIDLREVDAKQGGGNQRFKFIGEDDFSRKKGELRYETKSGDTYVQADTKGDGKVDMEIKFKDVSSLHESDFYL